jgi:4-amino-4-deoxy-L-arabinose transferase-like glycosyltransferase
VSSGRLGLGLLLAVSLALNTWGIGWGLPSAASWAPDEVLPSAVLEGMERGFSRGWHEKYPPLHYYLLALGYRPILSAEDLRPGQPIPPAVDHRLFLVSRGLSLLMAAGTILLVHRAAVEMGLDRRAALLSVALVAFMPPFVFYAKLANLDGPYVFWWVLSLVFLLRVLKRPRLADYLLLAGSAAAAAATKDQAYGLYVLVPVLLAVGRYRREPRRGWGRAILGLEMLLAAACFALLLAAAYKLPANWEGLRAHFQLITGAASLDFREFSPDALGMLGLLGSIGLHLAFVLGPPQLLVCVLGVLWTLSLRPRPVPPALLVPGLSYTVFFLGVVLYCYDRFVIPLAVLLAFFGGALLSTAWAKGLGWRVATVAMLAYGALRAASVDLAMANDSRYAVEDWLRRNTAGGLVGAIGPLEYLPRLEGLRARRVGPAVDRLLKIRPDYVVVNADHALRSEPGTGDWAVYTGLDQGTLGYREVLRHRFRSPWLVLDPETLVDRGTQRLRSNLAKVNPEIRVYAAEGPAPGEAPSPAPEASVVRSPQGLPAPASRASGAEGAAATSGRLSQTRFSLARPFSNCGPSMPSTPSPK